MDERIAFAAVLPLCAVVERADAPVDRGMAAAAAPHRAGAAAVASEEPLAGLTVLALDDQEETRDALEAVLCANGARVLLAVSGDDALAQLSPMPRHMWPHVLCDIVLGAEDGCGVLKRVRQLETHHAVPSVQHLPAIALSGYSEAAQRAVQCGFAAHLTKPVAVDVLVDAIRATAWRTMSLPCARPVADAVAQTRE